MDDDDYGGSVCKNDRNAIASHDDTVYTSRQ